MGTARFTGDLGSGLCFCGLGAGLLILQNLWSDSDFPGSFPQAFCVIDREARPRVTCDLARAHGWLPRQDFISMNTHLRVRECILWCSFYDVLIPYRWTYLGISLVPGLSDSSSRELTVVSRTNLVSSWQQDQDFWSIWFLRFSLVAQTYLTLCNPMDCGMPGLFVHHQILELAQNHVHRVSDAIQPSYPLLSPTPPAFNVSQHQGLL